MSKELGLGIIGAGHGARVHLPAAFASGEFRIVSIYGRTRSLDRRSLPDGTEVTDSWEEVIADASVDAVVIATPPEAHHAVFREATQSGKHILIEKPMGSDLSQCRLIHREAGVGKSIVGVNLQFRYEPALEELIRLCSVGELGALQRIDVRWGFGAGANSAGKDWKGDVDRGGGTLLNLGPHILDYSRLLLGLGADEEIFDHADIRVQGPDRYAVDLAGGVALSLDLSPVEEKEESVHSVKVTGANGSASFHHGFPFLFADQSLWVDSPARKGRMELSLKPFEGDSRIPSQALLYRAFAKAIIHSDDTELPSTREALFAQINLHKFREAAFA